MRHRSLLRLALALAAALSAAACGGGKGSGSSGSTTTTGNGAAVEQPAAPTPNQVCEHLADLVAREIGRVDPSIRASSVRDCTVDMEEEARLRGPNDWALVATCVMETQDAAGIDECDRKYPAPATATGGGGTTGSTVGGTREDLACDHVITVIEREEGQVLPADSRGQLHAECLDALAEERMNMTGAQYDAFVACISAVTTAAEIDQCEGN